MTYLAICDHGKRIIDARDARSAGLLYKCDKGCSARVYTANKKDVVIVTAQQPATTKKKHKSVGQTDWVSPV